MTADDKGLSRRMIARRARVGFAIVIALAWGCDPAPADDAGTPTEDAGVQDSGSTMVDSGADPMDGGGLDVDSGADPMDGGGLDVDSGADPMDGGGMNPDAGMMMATPDFALPRSAQTFCTTLNGTTWSRDDGCAMTYADDDPLAPAGQAAQQTALPAIDLTISGAVVTDNVTGLAWQRCGLGLTLNGDACEGTAAGVDQATAEADCAALTDMGLTWRLPTVIELTTIVDLDESRPAFDQTVFPDAAMGARSWTSDTEGNNGWIVRHATGAAEVTRSANNSAARCVAGVGPTIAFTDEGDGTVSEAATALVWLRCPLGASAPDTSTACDGHELFDWAASLNACESLDFAGRTDWRLPTMRELSTLVEYSTTGPAIDDAVFPTNPRDRFATWAADTAPTTPGDAYAVEFFGAGETVASRPKFTASLARCVAGP